MKKKTLYDDLAVDKKSTPDQIKKAFRKKAKQTHPDNGGKSDEFRTIARHTISCQMKINGSGTIMAKTRIT